MGGGHDGMGEGHDGRGAHNEGSAREIKTRLDDKNYTHKRGGGISEERKRQVTPLLGLM